VPNRQCGRFRSAVVKRDLERIVDFRRDAAAALLNAA
jgi:hypothetical protein